MRKLLGIVAGMTFVCAAFGQDATTPPANEHEVLTVQGRGVQIYSCTKTPLGPQWVFVAPAARLFDKAGIEVGTHGDGPVWHLQDGSSIVGQVVSKSPSPDAGSVPWLLVKAVSSDGKGKLEGVEFIRRSETKGGVAPPGACDIGALTRVPYSTTYTFYSSKK
jgi:hypothetical protein